MTEQQKQEIIGFFTGKEAYAFKGVVFLFDQIPEKKLQNAVKNYAPLQNGEEVVLLYEYSAKEGFVLTTSTLYVNQPTYPGCSVRAAAAVSDIGGFSWRKGKGLVNPEQYIDINAGSKKLTIQYLCGKELMSALEKTLAVLKGGTAASGATAAASSGAAPQTAARESTAGAEITETLSDVAGKAKDVLGKLGGLFGKK
jgi:hypothetical protein